MGLSLLLPSDGPFTDIIGKPMQPRALLWALYRVGLNLSPHNSDTKWIDVAVKDLAVEELFCKELALLG